jgi:hypothetical protein
LELCREVDRAQNRLVIRVMKIAMANVLHATTPVIANTAAITSAVVLVDVLAT